MRTRKYDTLSDVSCALCFLTKKTNQLVNTATALRKMQTYAEMLLCNHFIAKQLNVLKFLMQQPI